MKPVVWIEPKPGTKGFKPPVSWASLRYFVNRGVGRCVVDPPPPATGITGMFSKSLAPTHPLAAQTAIEMLSLIDGGYGELPIQLVEETARQRARNTLRRERQRNRRKRCR